MIKIAICGSVAGVGKSTAANYLEKQYGFTQLNFADGIYQIAQDYFDMKQKDRGLLIGIGEDLRKYDEKVWIKHTFKRAEGLDNVVIGDMRKKSEFDEAIKQGFYPVRIVCDRHIAIQRILARDEQCDVGLLDSQTEIETRDIDMPIISNYGSFEELYEQLDRLIIILKEGGKDDLWMLPKTNSR